MPNAKRVTFNKFTKIISINVNGYRAREAELCRYVKDQEGDCIVAITDTRLREETGINCINGYSMIRADKESTQTMATAGGVALMVPNTWTCVRQDLAKGNDFEALAVILLSPEANHPPMKIVVIYNHPGHYLPEILLKQFKEITFNGHEIGGFIVGDLNCPHAVFGSRTSNEFGSRLIRNLNQEDFLFFPTQSPTYFSNATGLENVLDLVIADQEGSQYLESCYVEGDVGSDHLPVIAKLCFGKRPVPRVKVDFSQWAKTVDMKLENFMAPESIDDFIDRLNRIFKESREENSWVYVPKKRALPREILEDIKLRKSLLKNRKKATTDIAKRVLTKQYNKINHKIQEQIKVFDENEIQALAERVGNSRTTYDMWRSFNQFKNKNRQAEEPEAPLTKPDGKMTADNNERCAEFARYLGTVHQTPDDPLFDNAFKSEIDSQIQAEPVIINNESIPPIQLPNLKELLLETKAKSSPGEDGVSYALLKKCSDNTKQVICNLLNLCLAKNEFPTLWKKAKVRMLPKPGRDKRRAANYRPISLLSCLGKILERYIYIYLIKELQDKKFFNKNQAGFIKGRSAHEHLFRLAQGIENGFKRRDCTLGLFLDVKAAFDSVWANGLKYKIKKIGLSAQLKNLLFSFLDNRSLNVFIPYGANGIWSDTVDLRAGTPQGSCLSPLLYIIFVNDLTDCLDLSQVCASQYADDVGMWTTDANAQVAERRLQKQVINLEKWCRKWHVSLHPAKSQLILYTKCPRHGEQLPNGPSIIVFGEQIKVAKEADFLGVKFDARLTWEPQFRKMVAKAYSRLNLLRAISAASKTGPSPNVIRDLYKKTILSIFEYSAICIANATETHMRKIQIIQNQAIRVMLQTPAYVSIDDLHDCAGLLTVKHHLIGCAKKRISSMEKSSPLIKDVIEEHKSVSHIRENPSTLDIIGT